MPFNTYLFILAFLPAALCLYYMFALTRLHPLRLVVLTVLTIVFYAIAASRYLPLLLGSIIFNYSFAKAIAYLQGRNRTIVLTVGVTANVAVLMYYKYTGFLVENMNVLLGIHISVPNILLPLAISFYTFQQIAFLVDTSRGLVKPSHPLAYASSILFFPYIISGPITFYREVGPQLERRPVAHAAPANILIGLSIFSLGLFKKAVVADTFALWVDPAFGGVAAGGSIGFLGAWGVAAAYFLQIYFDFSGYSDMAIGVARMLGIVLPLNFHSPVRSTSIIDFWRRWHMTLGRFVNVYIFQPISVPLSRWAAMRGFGRRGMLIVGTLCPTFLTMVIIGAWHGGNWTYFAFGALHGSFMVANESWRFIRRKKRRGAIITWRQRAVGNVLTMAAVLIALVAFRSPEMTTTVRIWSAMIGAHGIGSGIASWPVLKPLGGWGLLMALAPGFAFAYLMPNTQQFMARFEPALEWAKWRVISPPVLSILWRPTAAWAMALGVALLVGLAFIGRGGNTSFVYFGF